MATANEAYFDAAIRNQVGVRRFTNAEVRKILALLEKSDRRMSELLRKRLPSINPGDLTSARFASMIDSIRDIRGTLNADIRVELRRDLVGFAATERDFEVDAIKFFLPFDAEVATVSLQQVRAAVSARPFSGGVGASRTLSTWFADLKRADRKRITEAVQLAVAEGLTTDEATRLVVGTRANKFRDGVLAISRKNAETVIRTAINHVSNVAREEVWDANEDIIDALRWTATLDGRTSAICRARDGKYAPVGSKPLPDGLDPLQPPGARPPAHPNCRSVMVAAFDIDGVVQVMGERPTVRDTRTRQTREKDFRKEARDAVGASEWSAMTPAERNAAIRNRRQAWATENIGQVPAETDYQAWLTRQPARFQDDVLGKTKGALFRRGDLRLDKMVDRVGDELTLEELAKTKPQVFEDANLDPSEFVE